MTKFLSITTVHISTSNQENQDDEGLVKKARKEADAFAVLYDRHVKAVYRYLYSKVGSSKDAEDLTSQVFLAAVESLHRYPPGVGFRAWLFGIARRKTADFYRKQRPRVLLDEVEMVPSPADSPLAQVAHGQSILELTHLIAQLGEDEQELLRLRFGGNLSFAEIGGLVGMKESAVKMRLYRLIERLQKAMEAEND